MTPLGLGAGFYGLGPTMGSDNAASVVTPIGTAVRVNRAGTPGYGVWFEASILQSTFRGSFTIAFWIKAADGHRTEQNLFGVFGDDSNKMYCTTFTAGTLSFEFMADDDVHTNRTDASVFASGANAYKHIAITMTLNEGGNSSSIIYIDGAAVATSIVSSREITAAKHATWDENNKAFAIGALGGYGYTRDSIDADIAEFAIWNTVLDADAIAEIEDMGVPTASNFPDLTTALGNYDEESGLVTYHKLNDYSGGIANERIITSAESKGVLIGDSIFV